jgi:hypothetical protein
MLMLQVRTSMKRVTIVWGLKVVREAMKTHKALAQVGEWVFPMGNPILKTDGDMLHKDLR